MKANTLMPELLHPMDAYWRAANCLSVGQIYLGGFKLQVQRVNDDAAV